MLEMQLLPKLVHYFEHPILWQTGLFDKIKSALPDTYYRVMLSYQTNCTVRSENALLRARLICARVPQGSVLRLIYLVYDSDVRSSSTAVSAQFADDSASG